jgi:predicted CXXCH cytochrome family protein
MRILMLIVLLGLLFLIISRVTGRPSPHLLDASCQTCHLAKEKITSENAHLLMDTQEALCSSCHPNAVKASHPSGFFPNRTLPDSYKLNWQKKLTCSTCHDVHSEKRGLLVTELTGKDFCHSCHDEGFFSNMKDLGSSLFISGHSVPDGTHFSGQMDSFSAKCIECHSKESGNLNVTRSGNFTISHSGGAGLGHPIGRDYQKAAEYGGYRPIHLLDKRINLPEGKVSCISCHKAFDKEHGAGVFNKNERFKLCNSCHDL